MKKRKDGGGGGWFGQFGKFAVNCGGSSPISKADASTAVKTHVLLEHCDV